MLTKAAFIWSKIALFWNIKILEQLSSILIHFKM